MKLAIQFGAGAIGRGLMGKILHDSGYHVIFVDVFQDLVDRINNDGYFTAEYLDHDSKLENLNNVSALCSSNEKDLEEIYKKITQTEIITTSVRVENLESTAEILAKGLEARSKEKKRAVIMAFENAFRASDILKKYILEKSSLSKEELDSVATFPNTVTDRVVQNKMNDYGLVVEISDDFEAVIEKNKLNNPNEKPIKGADYSDNIDRDLERKLFLVNGVHAACAYLGYKKGFTMMDQAFNDSDIMKIIKGIIAESSEVLIKKYSIDREELSEFCESKLNRFLKTASHDSIERVGRDPIRKLGDTDRLVAPAKRAIENNLKFDNLAIAIAAAYAYDFNGDEKATILNDFIRKNGIEKAIEKYSNITVEDEKELFEKIVEEYNFLAN